MTGLKGGWRWAGVFLGVPTTGKHPPEASSEGRGGSIGRAKEVISSHPLSSRTPQVNPEELASSCLPGPTAPPCKVAASG